jgi:hypothetical protein
LEAFVLDTEPVVAHIDHMPQEPSTDIAVHLPDRPLVVPGILDRKVGRVTPVGGGVVGGLLGAAAALLIPGLGPALAGGILAVTLGGAALGAVAGSFAGALTGFGVPEEEAMYYQNELEMGRTIITVKAPERYQEALEILRQDGAYDATARANPQNVPLQSSNTGPDETHDPDATMKHPAVEKAGAYTSEPLSNAPEDQPTAYQPASRVYDRSAETGTPESDTYDTHGADESSR